MSLGNGNGDMVPFHGCWDPTSPLTLVQESGKERFSKKNYLFRKQMEPFVPHQKRALRPDDGQGY